MYIYIHIYIYLHIYIYMRQEPLRIMCRFSLVHCKSCPFEPLSLKKCHRSTSAHH